MQKNNLYSSKKVAIVCRTIFPSQSPRANRATHLAIELAHRGYEVTIYALLGNYDYNLFKQKYNVKLSNLGRSVAGNGNSDDGKKNTGFWYKLLKYFFGRLVMFPEVELMFMIYKNRKGILQNDYIISIATPFAIHFGVNLLNTKNKIWISDCGDPFMGNPVYKYPFYFKFIENSWAKNTDYITIPTKMALAAYDAHYHSKIRIIPQGFPIPGDLNKNYVKGNTPKFCYSGVVYNDYRDPTKFLDFLSTLDFPFEFIVYTKTKEIFENYKSKLGDKLVVRDYIPREHLLIELSKMDFLLNIKNNSQVQEPSKLIDYYIAHRPIVEISSEFTNEEKAEFMSSLKYNFSAKKYDVEKFNIKNVAQQFIELFK